MSRTSRWASSWHTVVFEGLSRRIAGAGARAGARARARAGARAAGAKVAKGAAAAAAATATAGGAMRTRVQGTTQGKQFWCDKIFKMEK